MLRILGLKNVRNFNNFNNYDKCNLIRQNTGYSLKLFCENLSEVKNISEFKTGLTFLTEGKFEQAEQHLKECLKIFKSIGQTDTMAYLFVLKKYTQTLFYNKKLQECESILLASLELSKGIMKDKPELTFPFYRNLLAFYTYTNISKGSELIDSYITSEDPFFTKHKKFFYFAGGAIKLLNNEYSLARTYMNYTMSLSDLPLEFQAFNMHNMALLNTEMARDCELLEGEELKKWLKDFNFPDPSIANKESFFLYKQTLARLELEKTEIEREEKEKVALRNFLYSQNEIPEKEEDEVLVVNAFKNPQSGISITNIAEMLFEKGKEKDKQTAFWLKTGIKHYENYEKENISRHLIIFALFYSQLGQSLYAEGLYRKAIEILKNNYFGNMNYNLVFAMNMYGRLLLRQDKRANEANEMLEKSESLAATLPFWYHRMVKLRYLDFDFN